MEITSKKHFYLGIVLGILGLSTVSSAVGAAFRGDVFSAFGAVTAAFIGAAFFYGAYRLVQKGTGRA